jgi:hypothetical protein
MFYVRLKLREPKERIIPKGPGFSWPQTIVCDIDDTVISFKAPKHRPRRSNHEQLMPKRFYQMDEMIFRSNYDKGFKVSDNWKVFELFHRTWAFNGPWFTGTLGELRMYFKLVKPVNCENPDFSLFHPRAFEKIVGDYLTNEFSRYIDKEKGNKHHYIAPVDWQPLKSLPVVAVRLQVISDETVARDSIRHFVFFPIADQVMACIQFIPSQLRAASQEELDKRVSRSTMYELMDQIIDSFELKLSPQAIENQKAALAGLDDTSLVKDYPPLKWDRPSTVEEMEKLEQ